MTSEFNLICFCAICWVSKFWTVILSGPDALMMKPRTAPPWHWCVHLHLVPVRWLRTSLSEYLQRDRQWVCSHGSIRGDWGSRNACHCCWFCKLLWNLLAAFWYSGERGMTSLILRNVFSSLWIQRLYNLWKSRLSTKGFSRLHFVVAWSTFLMTISGNRSLLYWKLGAGVGRLDCW